MNRPEKEKVLHKLDVVSLFKVHAHGEWTRARWRDFAVIYGHLNQWEITISREVLLTSCTPLRLSHAFAHYHYSHCCCLLGLFA